MYVYMYIYVYIDIYVVHICIYMWSIYVSMYVYIHMFIYLLNFLHAIAKISTTLLLTKDFQTHRRPVEMSWTSPERVQEEPNGLVMADRC